MVKNYFGKIYNPLDIDIVMKEILVSDIMTREPNIVKPEVDLSECAKIMVKKKTGSLLLVDKKHFLGFISRKDILWALVKKSKEDLSKIKAIDISPKKIATIKPMATIEQALDKMNKLKFERLPVINDKELVGIITLKDILNFHPETYLELDEFAQIREETEKLKRIKSKIEFVQEGICGECGKENRLYQSEGVLICGSCMNT